MGFEYQSHLQLNLFAPVKCDSGSETAIKGM